MVEASSRDLRLKNAANNHNRKNCPEEAALAAQMNGLLASDIRNSPAECLSETTRPLRRAPCSRYSGDLRSYLR